LNAQDDGAGPAVDPKEQPVERSFAKDLISPQALLATVPGALIDQFHRFPTGWREGAGGLAERAASLYGQYVIGDAIERGVKAMDHENTRYIRRGDGNFFARMGHIICFTVVATKPDGSYMPAYSALANDYGSWAIATLWSPARYRTPGSIFEWGGANVGVRAAGNLFREFWPDIKSAFRKH
jgi:hypothetical protein